MSCADLGKDGPETGVAALTHVLVKGWSITCFENLNNGHVRCKENVRWFEAQEWTFTPGKLSCEYRYQA